MGSSGKVDFGKKALALDSNAKRILWSSNPKLPKAPKYNQVNKAAENYIEALVKIKKLNLQGKVLKVNDIAALTRIAAGVLQCDASLVRPLTQNFLNVLMDASTIDLLAWQIAGNRKTVLTKEANLFNNRQSEICWMAGVIVSISTCVASQNQYAKIKLIDGPGAGFIVYAKMPKKLFFLSHALGALKKGADKKIKGLQSPKQCVLFKVMVYVNGQTPAYTLEENINFKRIVRSTSSQMVGWLKASPAQKKSNRSLFHERMSPCIHGFMQTCHECPLGYDGKNACSRACRPKQLLNPASTPIQLTLKGKNLCLKNLEEV